MRRRTTSVLVIALVGTGATLASGPAAAADCVARVYGLVQTVDADEAALGGMTVELVGTGAAAHLGVVGSATTRADGWYLVETACLDVDVVVRASDPSGFHGPRYAPYATDAGSAQVARLDGGPSTMANVYLREPGRFVAVEPTRVIDTRADEGGPVGPGENAAFLFDELPVDTTAVVLNLTATEGTAPTSFVSAQPTRDAGVPTTSVINATAGRDVANLVTIPVSRWTESGGPEVVLYNDAGWTHLVADIQGYYVPDPSGAGFVPVTPDRVLDTRESTPVGPHGTRSLDLAGPGAPAPADAVAAAITVTSTEATAATSYVSVYPSDAVDGPATSALNAYRGDDVPNLAIVPLGPDGAVTLYNDQGSTHLVVDVVGWFVESGGADYYAIDPRRSSGSGALPGGVSAHFDAAGLGGDVRDDAVAMAVNLTTAGAQVPSYLTVHPTGASRPLASNANARPGADVATGVLTGLDQGFSVYNDRGTLLALVDAYGWFAVND
ncbi:hypothetical protein [Cellulomonas biazotea]|uniref:Uncharacterized protein n=1 Tax=Cellulomonas biazotea TaxID=1709 RepID=A0A402DLL9_9CELL|nr:hypothetical protein [Cellulomonas biazotea]GCE75029.1 hypothetical protein CBZ_00850 [Cellulomonas biazotea]